jgi:hypothetical protein
MTTEQRLERLERENKWMRRIGAVAVAVFAAVFLMGQDKAKDLPDLEVRSLVVKDKDGRIRARLGMSRKLHKPGDPFLQGAPVDYPSLVMFDKHGRKQLSLGARVIPSLAMYNFNEQDSMRLSGGISPTVDLFGANEKPRAALCRSGLLLYDSRSKPRVSLSVSKNLVQRVGEEVGGLDLIDSTGGTRASLEVSEHSASLGLFDSNEERRVMLHVFEDSPTLDLLDKHGGTRATLGVTTAVNKVTGAIMTTAENTLTLLDAKGKVIWKAPKD